MLVSILINNYNYNDYVGECIESALGQTYRNIEVILCDDHSTDGSLETINKYKDKIKIIKTLIHGDQPCFNQANSIWRAYEVSKGDIICLLDADDLFLDIKVEKVVDAFKASEDVVLVQHPFREVDRLGRATGNIRPRLKKCDPKSYIYKTNNLVGLFAQTSALSFRREYLEKVLPIQRDKYNLVWPDVRLSRQSIFHGGILTLSEPLAEYRVHSNNDSHKLKNKEMQNDVITQMYEYFNEKAEFYGGGTIEINNSVNKIGLNRIHTFMNYLVSTEPIVEKLAYVKNVIFSRTGKVINKFFTNKRR